MLFINLIILSLCLLKSVKSADTTVNEIMMINTYCNFTCGVENTVCKRNPCRISRRRCREIAHMIPVNTTEEKAHILKLHNEVRAKVARGEDQYLKTGANNMNALSYTEELAFSAQCWANSCEGVKDKCRTTPNFYNVGQNIYIADESFEDNITDLWEEAINDWSTHHDFNENYINRFDEIEDYPNKNFVQMIWAPTTHIGCGKIFTGEKIHVVCNYAPGCACGSRVFRKGNGCVEAKKRLSSDDAIKYKGLCGESKVLKPYEIKWREPFLLNGVKIEKCVLHACSLVIWIAMFNLIAITFYLNNPSITI